MCGGGVMITPETIDAQGSSLSELSFLGPLLQRWSRRVAITEDDRRAFAALPWTRKTFTRDAYLAREGEPTTVCTLLLTGMAFRQKLVSDGARQIISIHIPGEFVDIQNGLLDIADHNVQALTRAIVAIVPKGPLLEV